MHTSREGCRLGRVRQFVTPRAPEADLSDNMRCHLSVRHSRCMVELQGNDGAGFKGLSTRRIRNWPILHAEDRPSYEQASAFCRVGETYISEASVTKPSAATVPTEIPMLIGGEWRAAEETYEVRDPYRGTVVSHAPLSSLADLDDALKAAVSAKAKAAATPAYERAALLRRAGKLLVERAEQAAEIMARETGKAIKDAKAEIVRSQDTLSLSAEEAVRIEGEHVPLDASAMGAGKICFMRVSGWRRRRYYAVQRAIQSRLSQDRASNRCRKHAGAQGTPAVAGVIHALAQSSLMPAASRLCQRALRGSRRACPRARSKSRFHYVFGSSRVGAEIKAASGLRRVALELGGNGPISFVKTLPSRRRLHPVHAIQCNSRVRVSFRFRTSLYTQR